MVEVEAVEVIHDLTQVLLELDLEEVGVGEVSLAVLCHWQA